MTKRFVGNGNTWIGADRKMRGWKIVCGGCHATSRTFSARHGATLAPDILARKFAEIGWYVGRRESEDLCPDCYDRWQRRHQRSETPKETNERAALAAAPPIPAPAPRVLWEEPPPTAAQNGTHIDSMPPQRKPTWPSSWPHSLVALLDAIFGLPEDFAEQCATLPDEVLVDLAQSRGLDASNVRAVATFLSEIGLATEQSNYEVARMALVKALELMRDDEIWQEPQQRQELCKLIHDLSDLAGAKVVEGRAKPSPSKPAYVTPGLGDTNRALLARVRAMVSSSGARK